VYLQPRGQPFKIVPYSHTHETTKAQIKPGVIRKVDNVDEVLDFGAM
jgi:hypothetical protein